MLRVKKKYCFAKELRVCAPVLEVPTTVDPNPELKSFGHCAIWLCYNLYTSTWQQSSRSIATGKSFVTMHQFQKLIQIMNIS